MSNADWERVKQLVHEALLLPAAERTQFLAEVCSSEPEVLAEVESLLAAERGIDAEFLAHSPLQCDELETLQPGQTFERRFILQKPLGEGGMGQVWLAQQVEPMRRSVAIKLIRGGMYDENMARRFRAERQSLAIMDHAYIAKVFEAGATAQGQPFFVMEYVRGQPITDYCDARNLSVRERIELFILACEGVQHAHQKAILHRDLKPSNILICEADGRAVPRLIDFGLARPLSKSEDDSLSRTLGDLICTPGFASPEQIDPNVQDVDTRSDVYSLGAVLYVLLTGFKPFSPSSSERFAHEAWLRQLREEEPSRPSTRVGAERRSGSTIAASRSLTAKGLVAVLRGDLDAILLKALARDRERRYGSPLDLASDLRRYLQGEVVSARSAGTAVQLWKFVRRHQLVAGIAALVIVLCVLAGTAGLLAVQRGREARNQTQLTIAAQARLLTEAAAQFVRAADIPRAASVILGVFTEPQFARSRDALAQGVLQSVRAADMQLSVLSGHQGWVYSGAYSPDGSTILTAGADGTFRLWDSRSGTALLVVQAHKGNVYDASFSGDGRRIVTAGLDRTARIWDAKSGTLLGTLSGHGERVYTARFSADGRRILTASADRTARIWDATSGALIREFRGHEDFVRAASFSPDGRQIATASFDHTVRLWDAQTGAALKRLVGHTDRVYSVQFSPDGRQVLTSSADRTARIWDAATGMQQLVLLGHTDPVFAAGYSADGTRIATASEDTTVRLWDARSGGTLQVFAGHQGSVFGAVFAPEGHAILSVANDQTARIWRADPRRQLMLATGHTSWTLDAQFSPDGRQILSASSDGTARLWDAATGAPLRTLSGHHGSVYAAVFSRDGHLIATASNDKLVRVWDLKSDQPMLELAGHRDRVTRVEFSPTDPQVASVSADGTGRIWDLGTGKLLRVVGGDNGSLRGLRYSPDGGRLAASADNGSTTIWDPRTGAKLGVIPGPGAEVLSIDFSPDGTRLAVAASDNTARLYDVATGAELMRYSGHTSALWYVRFSPDGQRLLTSSSDHTARLWDVRTGVPLLELRGHLAEVNSAVFSPDGTQVVTTSDDTTVRSWDARINAPLETEVLWLAAAELDPLSDTERQRFGLARLQGDYRSRPVGDPVALARTAEQEERDGSQAADTGTRTQYWLDAFAHYAAATSIAQRQGWPEERWRNWRYRRGSLARVLEREGLMREVAARYQPFASISADETSARP